MNIDDPKFTAHVLGEVEDLTPEERAEIEALLADDPAAAVEAAETRAFAAQLRDELGSEGATFLNEQQRIAVFSAVEEGSAAKKIARFPRRAPILVALAASIVVFASAALIYWGLQREKVATQAALARASEGDRVRSFVGMTVTLDAEKPTAPDPLLAVASGTLTSASTPPPLGLSPRSPLIAGANSPSITTPTFALATASPPPNDPNQDYLQRLYITGQTRSRDKVIRREIQGPPHDVFDTRNVYENKAGMVTVDQYVALREASQGQTAVAPSQMPMVVPTAPMGIVAAGGTVMPAIQSVDYAGYPTGAASSVRQRLYPVPGYPTFLPVPSARGEAVYGAVMESEFLAVSDQPLSTFSIDVDTAGYSIVRRFLNDGQRPPPDAVRIEELLNYFTYDYPQPKGDAPFSTTMEVADCPWEPDHRLVRIGLKGREMPREHRPPSNLVFLIDVSGSMDMPNKLPLLKQCFGLLIDQLGAEDQVSIVTYAGESGCALEPTHDKQKMREAMRGLEAGGGTNGGSGLQMAYAIAEKSFIKGGTNRIILATDGDWNVGVTNESDLLNLIAAKAKSGVFLTALGFGVDNLKDRMLVNLADRGNGHYAYIDTLLEAKKVFVEQLTDTLVTIAKDVKIQVEFNPARVAAYRLIGYEKRALAKEDFNDDRKDAGEIGAGHTVTALYEVVPVGKEPPAPRVDPLKYQAQPAAEATPAPKAQSGEPSKELLTLKLRYKAPEGSASQLLQFPLTDEGGTWAKSSRDFRFAAAVAGYGMLLRDSAYKGNTTWDSVTGWAHEGLGEDRSGYRAEFLSLVEKARDLGR